MFILLIRLLTNLTGLTDLYYVFHSHVFIHFKVNSQIYWDTGSWQVKSLINTFRLIQYIEGKLEYPLSGSYYPAGIHILKSVCRFLMLRGFSLFSPKLLLVQINWLLFQIRIYVLVTWEEKKRCKLEK